MYVIEFLPEADSDIGHFNLNDQRRIIDHVEDQLTLEPGVATRNRKPLRANPLARWELRIDRFRIFYDIDDANRVVTVVAIGEKTRNRLTIGGKEFVL
jgi:mRNA-degrading endonuclease RelE of RelBE toxin-antitoxin system